MSVHKIPWEDLPKPKEKKCPTCGADVIFHASRNLTKQGKVRFYPCNSMTRNDFHKCKPGDKPLIKQHLQNPELEEEDLEWIPEDTDPKADKPFLAVKELPPTLGQRPRGEKRPHTKCPWTDKNMCYRELCQFWKNNDCEILRGMITIPEDLKRIGSALWDLVKILEHKE